MNHWQMEKMFIDHILHVVILIILNFFAKSQ